VIESLVTTFVLVLARVGTFVAIMPFFGGAGLPRSVKAGLTMALTLFWYGSLDKVPAVDLTNKTVAAQWVVFLIVVGREALLGASLAFALGLFLAPIRVAGEYLGEEMGLIVSPFIDPASPNVAGAVTQMFEAIGVLVFLGIDGHHLFFAILNSTFHHLPVGQPIHLPSVGLVVDSVASVQELGLLLIAPVGMCLFLTSIVLALMAKVAPQLNIFSVGFALRALVGLATLWLFAPNLIAGMIAIFGRISELLGRLV
jgi:flagellar biosynthetic protein FliR